MLDKLKALGTDPRRLWMWTPVLAVSLVVVALLAMDITFGGADNVEPLNLAPPTSEAGTTPVLRTIVPRPPTATPVPTATVEAGPAAHIRDSTRLGHLETLKGGLEEYRQEEGRYPTTDGNVQTACVYDVDALCELKEFVDPFPSDPLGDPGKNGYWYVSDGKTYLLIAAMEAPENASPPEDCPEKVKEFTGKSQLLCLAGP